MPVVTPQRGLRIRLFASQNRRLLRRLTGFWDAKRDRWELMAMCPQPKQRLQRQS
jgi:hypothetical protein